MSSLDYREKQKLEALFGMSDGYVLNFSDRTFGDFFRDNADVDIHSAKYQTQGRSKARKLREFWRIESDQLVGSVLLALIENWQERPTPEGVELAEECKGIAYRLLAGGPNLTHLKDFAARLDVPHLAQQLKRIERSIEDDPVLAIGTAKELFETCCKTILDECGKQITEKDDVPTLTKQALRELNLVPDGIADGVKGAETIKRMLSNLATLVQGMAELRNLYGTGHGKHGKSGPIKPRHAKLAVGAAATAATFLFETHEELKTKAKKPQEERNGL